LGKVLIVIHDGIDPSRTYAALALRGIFNDKPFRVPGRHRLRQTGNIIVPPPLVDPIDKLTQGFAKRCRQNPNLGLRGSGGILLGTQGYKPCADGRRF